MKKYIGIILIYLTSNQAFTQSEGRISIENDAPEYFDEGMFLFKQKKYFDAIVSFDKAINLQPNNKEAYYYKGLSENHERMFIFAASTFNKLISIID